MTLLYGDDYRAPRARNSFGTGGTATMNGREDRFPLIRGDFHELRKRRGFMVWPSQAAGDQLG